MRHLRLGAVGIHGPRFWSAIPSRSYAIAMTSSCVVIPALIALLGLLLARFSVRQLIALRGELPAHPRRVDDAPAGRLSAQDDR
jgi:hypothetical protein